MSLVGLAQLSLLVVPLGAHADQGVVDTVTGALKSAAHTSEEAVSRWASAAVDGIETGALAARDGVETGVRWVAGGVRRGAEATAEAAGSVADKVKPQSE